MILECGVLKMTEWANCFRDIAGRVLSSPAIDGVLGFNEIILLRGESGSGKSTLLIDWVMSVATGKESWQGFKVGSGYVFYVPIFKRGSSQRGMAEWLQSNGKTAGDCSRLFVGTSAVDIDTDEDCDRLISVFRDMPEPPSLVVIDPLVLFFDDTREGLMYLKRVIRNCRKIQNKYSGMTFVFSGESAREAGDSRCSVFMEDAVDVLYSLSETGLREEKNRNAKGREKPIEISS